MIERDRRSINNHIQVNTFEIQKTNFFITFLILIVSFSWLVDLTVFWRIIVLVFIVIILGLACWNFFWRTILWWDIDWNGWLWKKEYLISLQLIRERENNLKNTYQSLSSLRAILNKYILCLLFLIFIILFMQKSNLIIIDWNSNQTNDVHIPKALSENPQILVGEGGNPISQETQTNSSNINFAIQQ